MDGGPPASSAAAGSVASANKSIEAGRTAMGTVDHDADEVIRKGRIERLPQRVQEALGELSGAAKEGLLALSVGVRRVPVSRPRARTADATARSSWALTRTSPRVTRSPT